MTSNSTTRLGAAELMRGLGLMVDGPVRWGSTVSSRRPGVFVVELPGGAERAPIDIVAVRRWVERVPSMTLDGEAATAHDVARRLEEWWLANEPLLYVGRSARAVGMRVANMYATALGDSKPYSGGHWLKTLSVLRDLRVWWSDTAAHEEYEDALLSAVAERNEGRVPFANLGGGDGKPKPHGLAGMLLEAPDAAAAAKTGPTAARTRTPARRATTTTRTTRTTKAAAATRPVPAPMLLSREGMDRLVAELDHLRTNVRPEVIARVKAARELGDLKENADYEYARKEQSFVEGRIQSLEALMRTGEVVDEAPSDLARLGSTVVVEVDGEQETYVLVSSAEADMRSGRISDVSPVGRALMGSRAGQKVTVTMPSGSTEYLVREVR